MRRVAGVALVFGPLAAGAWWWAHTSNPVEVVRLVLAVFIAAAFVASVLTGIGLLLPDDE